MFAVGGTTSAFRVGTGMCVLEVVVLGWLAPVGPWVGDAVSAGLSDCFSFRFSSSGLLARET